MDNSDNKWANDSFSEDEDEDSDELVYKKSSEIIGFGIHGVVTQCLNQSSGGILAVKIVKKNLLH